MILHLALQIGQVDVAHMLVERDVDLTAKNNYGETSLHVALRKGQGLKETLLA